MGIAHKYVNAEDLFDTIKAAHLANASTGRNIISKALSLKNANVSFTEIKNLLSFMHYLLNKFSFPLKVATLFTLPSVCRE